MRALFSGLSDSTQKVDRISIMWRKLLRHYRGPIRTRARTVVCVAVVLVVISSCARAPTLELEKVEEPPDLEQLDAAVREQLVELWRDLHEASRKEAELGAVWGALGQWFDVYGYATSAARCYRNAHRLDPEEPRWPYYLGRLGEDRGELEAARGDYTKATELAPEELAPRVRLGDLALQRQDLASAEARYREVLEAVPDNPGALLGKGRLALLRGDAAAALEPLESLARMQPEAVQVHYSLGLAWRQLGDEEQAAEHLQRVPEENLDQVSLDLGFSWDRELQRLNRGARSLTRRGIRAFRRGEHARAAVLLGQAVAADPDGPEKRINYALALSELGHWTAAEEQLSEALRRAEDRSELAAKAHLELGRLLAARRRQQAAVPHLEAALTIDPQSLPAHLELGRLRHHQGRLEEALAHYAAVRTTDRPLAGTRFWHAALLILLDRRQQAVAALEEDLGELGDERQLRLLLARLLSAAPEDELRDIACARRFLAEPTVPSDVLFAETAAMVAAAEGRFAAAVAWQRAAVAALDDQRPRTAAQTARRRLVLYERGEPCRNPWESRETPILVPVVAP